MKPHLRFLAAGAALALTGPAFAQSAPLPVDSLPAGARVRVQTEPGAWLTGRVFEVRGDTLFWAPDGAPGEALPLRPGIGIERSRGRVAGVHGVVAGAGALLGSAGLVAATRASDGGTCCAEPDAGELCRDEGDGIFEGTLCGTTRDVASGVVGGLAGAVLGSLLGQRLARERWQPVRIRPDFGAAALRLELSASLGASPRP